MSPEVYRPVGSRSKPLLLEETFYLFCTLYRNVRKRTELLIHSTSSLVSGASLHAPPFILWWLPSGFVGAGDAHANARPTSLSGLAQPQSQPRPYHNDHATTSSPFICGTSLMVYHSRLVGRRTMLTSTSSQHAFIQVDCSPQTLGNLSSQTEIMANCLSSLRSMERTSEPSRSHQWP